MRAEIVHAYTRAELGMRLPTSISHNITPSKGGVTGHYFGPELNIDTHADCVRYWVGAQRFHMRAADDGGRGMVDIAYTSGFCDHGYLFPGRGAGVRTGANGTTAGNNDWYACCWIGGSGETPTDRAIAAFTWGVQELRRVGGAGRGVVPHWRHKPTSCCGGPLNDLGVIPINNRDIVEESDVTTKHYAQAVIGHTDTDLKQGSVFAAWHGLGLVQVGTDGSLTSVTHPGNVATANIAFRVGQAARFADDSDFEAVYDFVGSDRTATAREVARALVEHPTIVKPGRPW